MPLKDEQVPEFHGKMPNVTSETLLKLRALATCYLCTKRSRTQALSWPSAVATCYLLLVPTKTPCSWIARKDAYFWNRRKNYCLEVLPLAATVYLLPLHQTPADNRMPYLLLLLVNRTSNKSTCRQQNTLPLKDELAPESPPKAPADSKTPCHCLRRFYCYCWLLLPLATCYLWRQTQLPTTGCPTSYSYLWTAPATKAPADSKTPCHWRTS